LIQKKSKNSRMGKGKGLIERKTIRIKRNFIIFEFKGIPPIKIKKLIVYANKFLSLKLFLISNYNKNYTL
jgi:ribosomal protein L16/L10AE